MPRKSHTHKYARVDTDSNPVWACALPGCNHFMPYHLRHLMVVNRQSICWECSEPFVLDAFALEDNQPKCGGCRLGLSNTEDTESPLSDKLAQFLANRSKTG